MWWGGTGHLAIRSGRLGGCFGCFVPFLHCGPGRHNRTGAEDTGAIGEWQTDGWDENMTAEKRVKIFQECCIFGHQNLAGPCVCSKRKLSFLTTEKGAYSHWFDLYARKSGGWCNDGAGGIWLERLVREQGRGGNGAVRQNQLHLTFILRWFYSTCHIWRQMCQTWIYMTLKKKVWFLSVGIWMLGYSNILTIRVQNSPEAQMEVRTTCQTRKVSD